MTALTLDMFHPAPWFADPARGVRVSYRSSGLAPRHVDHDAETAGMCSQKTGRNFLPRTGENVPPYESTTYEDAAQNTRAFAEAIAGALAAFYGHGHAAAKAVARAAGASPDAAENWLAGYNAPSGLHLVRLMAECDAVLTAVLAMAGRGETLAALHRADAIENLRRAADALARCDAAAPANGVRGDPGA